MRVITLPALRTPHWLVVFGLAAYAVVAAGLVPSFETLLGWFAARPEVAQAFRDPHFGRADALILLFSTLFLGPLACLLGLVALFFSMAVFGGFILPVVRWFNLPDWAATLAAIAVFAGAAWLYSDAWLPRSLWFVGLLARAIHVVFT